MSVQRISEDDNRSVLVVNFSVLSNLCEDADETARPCLDLEHPVIGNIIHDADIVAVAFDADVDHRLAERFGSISISRHLVESFHPEQSLKLFVNVKSMKISASSPIFKPEASIDSWPDWIFSLFGLESIVDEKDDLLVDVGGFEALEEVDGGLEIVRSPRVFTDLKGAEVSEDVLHEDAPIPFDEPSVNASSNKESVANEKSPLTLADPSTIVEEPSVETAEASVADEEPVDRDLTLYRFRLTKFKLLSLLRYKKRILDLSARRENPVTRGRMVKELIIG